MKRILLVMCVLTVGMLWGCGGQGGGRLTLKGQTITGTAAQPVELAGRFRTATYTADGRNNITMVLIEGPADRPTQAAVIRLFWMPRAGLTPIDSNATNASVHYIIFSDAVDAGAAGGVGPADEAEAGATVAGGAEVGGAGADRKVGIYAGAGFVYPHDNPSKGGMDVGVWQTTLRLADASDGFADLMGQAQLKGKFRAQRDDLATTAALERLGQQVTAALGYPRLVEQSSQDVGRVAVR